jgi:hypothetical protein
MAGKYRSKRDTLKKILNGEAICRWGRGGHAVALLVEAALQAGMSLVRFPIVSLEFFINIILLVTLWPWG